MRCLFLILFAIQTLSGQNSAMEIEVKGKIYHITGDNLTIVIGKNLTVNVKREVPEKVRSAIEQKYRVEIEKLDNAYKSGKITLKDRSKAKQEIQAKYESANAIAVKLANEFATISFEEKSFLFRLAYVIYMEGDVEGASEILNEQNLELNESCQAMQYLLVIAANWSLNNYDYAFKQLQLVVKKYPSFNTLSSYGDYCQLQKDYALAIELYTHAFLHKKNIFQENYLHIQMAFCYLMIGRFKEGNDHILNIQSGNQSISNLNNVDKDCFLPSPLSIDFYKKHQLKPALADSIIREQERSTVPHQEYKALFDYFKRQQEKKPH